MSSVTFSTSVGGDGSTVTDDANATTGLDGGGHRTRFVPALSQVVAVAGNVVTTAGQAAGSLAQATSQANNAAASAVTATTQATAAATSATSAATAATTAATQAAAATSASLTAAVASSATAAANSANASAGSATAAAGSATAAANSAAQAEAAANVGAATETTPGLIELATQAEVDAGTDAVRAVVPKYYKANVDARLLGDLTPVSLATSALVANTSADLGATVVDGIKKRSSADALHRSPNTVAHSFIYDTSRDSDGGAWTDKCGGTSWYQEPMSGEWLGRVNHLSEALSMVDGGWKIRHGKALPGVGFKNISSAGSFAYREITPEQQITGDLDVRVKVSMDDWTPSVQAVLAAHYGSSPVSSQWIMYVGTSGLLRLHLSNGTTSAAVSSTAATGFIDGTVHWVRATNVASTGATNFYTSEDGIAWTQLGTTVTHTILARNTGATQVYVEVGGYNSGSTENAAATFHQVEVYNGTALVTKFDGRTVRETKAGDYFQLATTGRYYSVPENWVANNQMSGAVAGVVGSGGVLPTGWSVTATGLTQEVVAVGTNGSGRKYIDLKLSGTSGSTSATVTFSAIGNAPLRNSESITASSEMALSGSALPAATYFQVTQYTPAASVLAAVPGTNLSLTASDALQSSVLAANSTTASNCSVAVCANYTSGAAMDFTLRITEPEVVLKAAPGTRQVRGMDVNENAIVVGIPAYRGNKRDFPKLSAIVAEAGAVNIYDLTEVGNPMWMSIRRSASGSVANLFGASSSTCSAVLALNGSLHIGGSSGAPSLREIKFVTDRSYQVDVSGTREILMSVASRNVDMTSSGGYLHMVVVNANRGIINNVANHVTGAVLPNAPIDPATGLAVPTIGVATGGGWTILKHDGTVVHSTTAAIAISRSQTVVRFDRRGDLIFEVGENNLNYRRAHAITGWTTFDQQFAEPRYSATAASSKGAMSVARSAYVNGIQVGAMNVPNYGLQLCRDVGSKTAQFGMPLAEIASTYSTGWMIGDTRKAYLCDGIDITANSATELVTNGSFTGGNTGWTAGNANSTVTNSSDTCVVTVVATGTQAGIYQNITTVPGKTYRVRWSVLANTTGQSVFAYVGTAGSFASGSMMSTSASGTTTNRDALFTATSTSHALSLASATAATTGSSFTLDNVSVIEVASDRSVQNNSAVSGTAQVYPQYVGTVSKTNVALAADLVCHKGFTVSSYISEPYTSALDYGTGDFTVSAWVQLPSTVTGNTITGAVWAEGAELWNNGTATVTGESQIVSSGVYRIYSSAGAVSSVQTPLANTVGRSYKVTFTVDSVAVAGGGIQFEGTGPSSVTVAVTATGTQTFYMVGSSSSGLTVKRASSATDIQISNVSIKEVTPLTVFDRGGKTQLGINAAGAAYARLYDGTTERFASSTVPLNNGGWHHLRMSYSGGRLRLGVNGEIAAVSTVGAPLLTLSDATAVTTLGVNNTLASPFPGQLALVKTGTSIPTESQHRFAYDQERRMFASGAKVLMPNHTGVNAITIDADTGSVIVSQPSATATLSGASRLIKFSGLVRKGYVDARGLSVQFSTAVASARGIDVAYQASILVGCNIYTPETNLSNDQVVRTKSRRTFDFDSISFTAATTSGSPTVTASAVVGTPYEGMIVEGTGIPAGSYIKAINGTSYTLSVNATATGSVTTLQRDFVVPDGLTVISVASGGTNKREGSTKDYVRTFDGFREVVIFNTAPSSATWVQIEAETL